MDARHHHSHSYSNNSNNSNISNSTLPASASASTSASPPTPSSSPSSSKPPPATTARRRAYAKRSCLKCREKKARCELPDLTVPSSKVPLLSDKACHRCKVLALDCVVWDGDRKRKPKIHTLDPNAANPLPSSSSSSSSSSKAAATDVPPSLHQLADVAARVSSDPPSSNASSTLASLQFFNPIRDVEPPFVNVAHPSLPLRAPKRQRIDQIQAEQRPSPSPSSSHQQQNPSSAQHPLGRTWTSLWRPLSVMVGYASQQPSFVNYLLSRVDTSLPPNIDARDLISKQTCLMLKPHLKTYVLWHPHLPHLDQLYDEYERAPTISSALLLCSMCLVASRHVMPLSADLPKKLSALVDNLGIQVLLSSPRELHAVQALELLLAQEPSLVGTKIAGQNQASRANALIGESLLAAAVSIATDMELENSISLVQQITDEIDNASAASTGLDPREHQARAASLSKAMAEASLWISLRIWQGHFVFATSSIKPIELSDLVQRTKCMIGRTAAGSRIMMTEDGQPSAQNASGNFAAGLDDEDNMLRSAGRTGLAYRLRTLAYMQEGVMQMQNILSSTPKQESEPSGPSSSEATMDALIKVCMARLAEQNEWLELLRLDFAPYVQLRSTFLLEDWAKFEFSSLWCITSMLAICAFMTGELNRGFSALDFVHAVRVDEVLRTYSQRLSHRRGFENQLVMGAFILFDRGYGYSAPYHTNPRCRNGCTSDNASKPPVLFEAIGAPLLLTSALAVDSCKTFLEMNACALMGFFFVPMFVNQHLLYMSQAINRLEDFDRNRYEYRAPGQVKQEPSARSSASHQVHEGRSITQIAALFISEMIDALQKMKFASALKRNPRFWVEGPTAVEGFVQSEAGEPKDAAAAQTRDPIQSVPEPVGTALPNETFLERSVHGFPSSSSTGAHQSHAETVPLAMDGSHLARPQNGHGGLHTNGGEWPNHLSHDGTGSDRAGASASVGGFGTNNLASFGGAANIGGGMHEIPLFDNILDSIFGSSDWTAYTSYQP